MKTLEFDDSPEEPKPSGFAEWEDGHRENFFSIQRARRLAHMERDVQVYRLRYERIYPGWEPPEIRWRIQKPTDLTYRKLITIRARPCRMVFHDHCKTFYDLLSENLTGTTLGSASPVAASRHPPKTRSASGKARPPSRSDDQNSTQSTGTRQGGASPCD